MSYQKAWKDFLAYACGSNVTEKEMQNQSQFGKTPAVSALIQCGNENEDVAFGIPRDIGLNLKNMDAYRGCMAAYMIGLYAESGYCCDEGDDGLIDFFLISLDRCKQLIEECIRQTGCEENQDEDEESEEEIHQDDIENNEYDEDEDEDYEDEESLMEKADLTLIFQEQPDLIKTYYGMGMATLAVMSRISRSRSLRDRLRKEGYVSNLCRQMDPYFPNVGFVPSILDMAEEETALLLSPSTGIGVEVALQQIDSNFVFFTLVQFALHHADLLEPLGADGFTYHDELELLAKHEGGSNQKQVGDSACFGYYAYPAWQQDGQFDPMQSVWGEGTLYEVPKLDGRFVILLDKPTIKRMWNNAFVQSTHSGLKPDVRVVRRLADEEAAAWIEKVREANKK